jgi:anthranilate synthase component 2
MLLLIDNYDSFTWNLAHYLSELGAEVVVRRNDALSAAEALAMGPEAIVLSPGPCDPDRAGICLDLIRANGGRVPLLGVCLGHQSIGQAHGGTVARCPEVMHGKISRIRHKGDGLFRDVPQDIAVTRYHSLEVRRDGFPADLEITAETESGVIMGLAHRERPVFGVQFHPESIASEHGKALLRNFLDIARAHALEAA